MTNCLRPSTLAALVMAPSDVPTPVTGRDSEASIGRPAKVVPPPSGAVPKVPAGFAVQIVATGLKQPRAIRMAPNGDTFLSERGTGRVLVFGGSCAGSAPAKPEVFAENLDRPYGIAFQPPADARHVYVAAGLAQPDADVSRGRGLAAVAP